MGEHTFGGVRILQNCPSFHFSNGKHRIKRGVVSQIKECAPKNCPIGSDSQTFYTKVA